MLSRDISDPPLTVIESWPAPNYVDPPDRGPALFVLSILLSILGALVVSLRTYSRVRITRSVGLDDALIWVSLGFAIALSALVAYANRIYYNSRHIWDIPLRTVVPHRRNVWLSQVCYISAATAVKTSILLFYRRLTIRCSKRYVIAIKIGMAYNLLYGAAFLLVLVLTCAPAQAYWMQHDSAWAKSHNYHCISEAVSLPLSGIFSVLGDIYATALPFFVIRELQMQSRQRMVLYTIFAVGNLVVVSGIIRTAVMYKLEYGTGTYDYTWYALWETWIWSLVEIWMSILCASAPALKPFFGKVLGSRLGRSGRSGSGTPGYGRSTMNIDMNRLSMQALNGYVRGQKGTEETGHSDSKSILVRTEVSVVEADKVSEEAFSMDTESFYGHDRSNADAMGVERNEVAPRHIARSVGAA